MMSKFVNLVLKMSGLILISALFFAAVATFLSLNTNLSEEAILGVSILFPLPFLVYGIYKLERSIH